MAPGGNTPITVALVDDYDVVLMGVANMFDQYRDRVVVAELDSNKAVEDAVDIVLYDCSPNRNRITTRSPFWLPIRAHAESWSTPGTFTRTLSAVPSSRSARLSIEDVASARVGSRAGGGACRRDGHQRCAGRARSAVGLDWPGRGEGLSDRESEILALITQGKSNAEVAALTYLSPNTVKSYIRSIYRKIEVGSRTQAVLWGVTHGFTPDHHRIEHWRGGP